MGSMKEAPLQGVGGLDLPVLKHYDIPFFGSLIPSETQVVQGRLNAIVVLHDDQGNEYVHKRRRNNIDILDHISEELRIIGFPALGGSFSFRSVAEESRFMNDAASIDLRVVAPVVVGPDFILLPFIEGKDLKDSLSVSDLDPLKHVLRDIFSAHSKGIVYGDRWPKNLIVKPDGTIIQIDFDLNIAGHYAKEFELAQFLYGVIRDSADKKSAVANLLSAVPPQATQGYNLTIIERFMMKYAQGYHPQEASQDDTHIIMESLRLLVHGLNLK